MPSYDLRCHSCGREWERFAPVAARYAPCETCQGPVEQTYQHSVQATPFIPYFDFALGQEVTSLAERWRFMRGEIDLETGERRGQLDYRDKVSPGDLSARRDRLEQQKRDARR